MLCISLSTLQSSPWCIAQVMAWLFHCILLVQTLSHCPVASITSVTIVPSVQINKRTLLSPAVKVVFLRFDLVVAAMVIVISYQSQGCPASALAREHSIEVACARWQAHICGCDSTANCIHLLFLVTRAAWVSFEFFIKSVGASRSFPLPFPPSLCTPIISCTVKQEIQSCRFC